MRAPSAGCPSLGRIAALAALVLATSTAAHAAVFTVNSTGDAADALPGDGACEVTVGSGLCTLRAAIHEANAIAGADFIAFAIASGVQTIKPLSALPTIADPLEIDGTTQPGFAGTPIIEITGPGDIQIDGLTITAGRSTIRGLVINRFGQGIRLAGEGGNVIAGNFVGTDVTGTIARPNNSDGIAVYTAANVIGGLTAEARNVISGNGTGVCLCQGATGNRVQGNFVGTDVSGTIAIPNGSIFYEVPFAGVALYSASGNTIGGAEPGAGNVISGNLGVGVQLLGAGQNVVQGNFIGVDATGEAPLPNHLDGVAIGSGARNVIGGTEPGAANVISGNEGPGVSVFVDFREGGTAEENLVQGNFIGVNAAVDALIGNADAGVEIYGTGLFRTSGNTVARNVIGGNGAGGVLIAGPAAIGNPVMLNVIAYNDGAGVAIAGNASRSGIFANATFGNAGLGIALGPDGVTPNDAGDADTGANTLQNFPVLTSAAASGATTTIQGVLESTPGTAYRLEFFASPACDAAGHGEGARFIGAVAVTTDGGGTATFSATAGGPLPAGWVVTATATNPASNTSEFSPCLAVDPA